MSGEEAGGGGVVGRRGVPRDGPGAGGRAGTWQYAGSLSASLGGIDQPLTSWFCASSRGG